MWLIVAATVCGACILIHVRCHHHHHHHHHQQQQQQQQRQWQDARWTVSGIKLHHLSPVQQAAATARRRVPWGATTRLRAALCRSLVPRRTEQRLRLPLRQTGRRQGPLYKTMQWFAQFNYTLNANWVAREISLLCV